MSKIETAEMIARSRMVNARALLEARADLNGYPFRHLTVQCRDGVTAERVTMAAAAAELLAQYGWELVNVGEFGASHIVYVFMRRLDVVPR